MVSVACHEEDMLQPWMEESRRLWGYQATVCGVAQSQIRLKRLHTSCVTFRGESDLYFHND